MPSAADFHLYSPDDPSLGSSSSMASHMSHRRAIVDKAKDVAAAYSQHSFWPFEESYPSLLLLAPFTARQLTGWLVGIKGMSACP